MEDRWIRPSVDTASHLESRANERLHILIDGVKDFAIFMLNPEGYVSTWNAGAERLKGYRADEIIGQHYSRFYPADDRAVGVINRELAIAEQQGRFEEEAWRVRKDGSRFWADVVITPLRNPAGELLGFGKVTRNLSDQAARSKDQFRAAIEAAPTGMILVDSGGRIVLVNHQIESLFGYHRDELIGHRIEMLVPERYRQLHPQTRAAFFHDPKSRPMGAGRELYGLHKNSTQVPIEIGLNPLETPEGHFVLASVLDITERKRSEREREELFERLQAVNTELEQRVQARTADLTANLKEREVLLQEVHHRVKNNLQVITSLISMQIRQIEAGASRTALEQCQTRIGAIALIHEKLYQSKDYARVPFSEYAKSLAESVFQMAGMARDTVSLEFAIEELTVAIDKAIPCGLMLNELITNALKHAFPGDRTGIIRVALATLADGRIRMAVSDDGVGLPYGLDPSTAGSLGMHLVRMLAHQVDGDLRIESSNGTSVTLTARLGD